MITSTPQRHAPTNRETLDIIFRLERNRFGDGTIIGEADIIGKSHGDDDSESMEQVTIKAPTESDASLLPGLPYRLYGRYKNHPRYGQQFVVDNWIRTQPTSREAIVNYLLRTAEIGKITCEIIFDLYGKHCLDRLRESPEDVSAAVMAENSRTRFSVKRAQKAADLLARDEATESIAVELIDLLTGRGFPKGLHRKIIGEFGAKSKELISRNPYLLLRFERVGFKSADNLYCELGLPKNKLKRQALCAWYAIESDRDGHTWLSKADVLRAMRGIVGASIDFEKAMKLATRAKLLDERRTCMNCGGKGDVKAIVPNVETGEIESQVQTCFMCQGSGGEQFFSTWQRSQNEQTIAKVVAYHNSKPAQWEEWLEGCDLGSLTDHQREQILFALQSRICAFGGIPGTGKTYTMARLVNGIIPRVGIDNIAVAAPTGKAAVRMTEVLASYGVDLQARTVHSLLGIVNDGGKIGFAHGPMNPFEQLVFVVDEMSMKDVDLFAAFLSALPENAHVLLIGDTNQLPPVGHGAPLRDLRKFGVAQGELEEIKRQKEPGKIVEACDTIRRGRPTFTFSPNVIIGSPENLGLLFSPSPRESLQLVVELLNSLAVGTTGSAGKIDPIWDCQVVVATNDKGELCRKSINKRLQAELNPLGTGDGNTPFRVGDKVICLKNGFVPDEDGGDDIFVANGEIGRVTEAAAGYTNVTLSNPARRVKIPRGQKSGSEGDDSSGSDTGCSFDLAYGVTCHKLQGSQAKVVIVVLDEAAKGLCTREWIYTAISRAESACWLVGKIETAQQMVRRVSLNKRKTFLVERLKAEMEQRVKDSVCWEV